jgi:hypothetical protein
MLSFLANAATSGMDSLWFKSANLGIHLLCGVLLYWLLIELLPRDAVLKQRVNAAALLVTALWLLHPMQVSTVLYVVQRMAQLSAMFVLFGLLAFVKGRKWLEGGRTRMAWAALFLAVPTATVLAVLSKENGALLPLLCGVIELGYFRPSPGSSRPRSIKVFFLVSLFLPACITLAWYSLHPQELLRGYDGRLFTLGDRLLTQPRVLMHYMSALLLPHGPSLGVYTDDFAVSRGLLTPSGTFWSIAGLGALTVGAWVARVRIPAFFTGIGLYFAGHLLESTVFPLEMYFEHRNYLPSAGFFLAVVGLGSWLFSKLLLRTDHPVRGARSLKWGAVALVLTLGVATWARAGIWSSLDTLVLQGLAEHPESVRANIDATRVFQAQGRNDEVQKILDNMAELNNPEARHVSAINTVAFQCMTNATATQTAVAGLSSMTGAKLELTEMLMMENLAGYVLEHRCQNLTKSQLASVIVDIVDAAPQPSTLTQMWRSRFFAAKLYASSSDLLRAQRQLEKAWATGYADPAVGAFLVEVKVARGDATGARSTLRQVETHLSNWDDPGHRKIAELKKRIAALDRQSSTSTL